jgi:ubiquitin-conjugating enzyme E2 Q
MTPRGEVGLISIPLEAVPRSRRPTSKLSPSNPKKKQKLIHADADGCSVSTLDEDRDLLLSDNEKEANEFEDDDFFDPTHPTKTEISAETESAIKGDSSSSVTKKFKFFKLLSKSTPATSAPAAPAAPAPSSATMTDFVPGHLDHSRLPALAPPQNASPMATQQLMKRFNSCKKTQESTPLHELGWFIDPEQLNNMFQWIVELHSFPEELPLAKQMKHKGITSIILELRFTDGFPFAPPFVRVIEPRFLPFAHGGGGHVTAGGSLCMELLTNDGWSPANDIESVLLQIRLAMCSTEPAPAQLMRGRVQSYSVDEAVSGFERSARMHGWRVPRGFTQEVLGMDAAQARRQ